MPSLPPLPDWSLPWTTQAFQSLHDSLTIINRKVDKLMTQASDFQGALDRNTAATDANTAASAQEIAQLQAVSQQLAAAVAQLSTSTPPTQAQLDQLNAATASLQASTATLKADDPAATPPPTPPA